MEPRLRRESDRDPGFAAWVAALPGAETVAQCIHCGQCAASCPLAAHMDRSPRQLLYLAREGFREDVLGSFMLWLCTSCYTCTVKCPRTIPVTDVLYALKRRAIDEGRVSRRFPIPTLAREFRRMVLADGRVHEGHLAMRFKMRTNPGSLFAMTGLGIGLLRTGRFPLRRERIRGRTQLVRLLAAVDRARAENGAPREVVA